MWISLALAVIMSFFGGIFPGSVNKPIHNKPVAMLVYSI